MQSCNKIGVSFTAFRMQGGYDGQGPGCTRKIGSYVNIYFFIMKKKRLSGNFEMKFVVNIV